MKPHLRLRVKVYGPRPEGFANLGWAIEYKDGQTSWYILSGDAIKAAAELIEYYDEEGA